TVTIVNPDGATSNPATVRINPAPQIVTSFLPNSVVNRPYPTTGGQSFGGTTPLTWSISPGSGLTINSTTGVISGAPPSAGNFDVLVTLSDAFKVSASRTFRVSILPVLDMSITGLPVTVTPGGNQPAFQLQVNVPGGYPLALRGRLTFSFQPDVDLQNPGVKDPAQNISAGPDVAIPAFSQGFGVLLSPGTSAGTITVTLSN